MITLLKITKMKITIKIAANFAKMKSCNNKTDQNNKFLFLQ